MSDTKTIYPGSTDEAFPELFDIRAKPPKLTGKKNGQLTDDQIRKFFEEVSTSTPRYTSL